MLHYEYFTHLPVEHLLLIFCFNSSDASSDDSEGGGRGSPFSLSLDVLAQVASDRLEKEPAKQGQSEKKKVMVIKIKFVIRY